MTDQQRPAARPQASNNQQGGGSGGSSGGGQNQPAPTSNPGTKGVPRAKYRAAPTQNRGTFSANRDGITSV